MQDLGLLSKATTEHADKMVWNDERKRLFRPEGSSFGLVYACKDGQVQEYNSPLGTRASGCMMLHDLPNAAHAELADCAEGSCGACCILVAAVCGGDLSMCC